MRNGYLAIAVLGLVLGCTPKDTEYTATEADADADADADTDTDTDADTDAGLPDPTVSLDEDFCDTEGSFPDQSGATSYFYGVFTVDDKGAWSGQERWILFATEEWEADGGEDCEVVWTMSGTEAATGSCSSCEFAVQLDATVDVSLTTCPPGLYAGDETFSVAYGVDDPGDGTAATYYTSSGNRLGSGYISDTAFNYLSDRSCTWF